MTAPDVLDRLEVRQPPEPGDFGRTLDLLAELLVDLALAKSGPDPGG